MLKLLRELRARIRYFIDRAFAREFAGQLLLFVVLLVLVTVFGTTAIFFGLLSERNAEVTGIPGEGEKGLGEALWWALSYVIRIEKFSEMYGASFPIVAYSFAMSIMGLAVFGVLVSLINNAMRRRIELLQQGDTPVKERGHILILGWNNRVFSVLRQLARLRPRSRVVILDDQEVQSMSEALRLAGIREERLTVILRRGVPSNGDELDRVAVSFASAIVVLSDESDDSGAIKTLVLLANYDDWADSRPTITAEIAIEQNFELAEIGARGRIHVVASSRVSSKVIVQTIRNRGLSRVYDELMSLEGNNIAVQRVADCNGKTLRQIAGGFPGAIPIGVTWEEAIEGQRRHKAGLNPEPDYDVAPDERLVLLTRKVPVEYRARSHAYRSEVFRRRRIKPGAPVKILMIGWSDILHDILRELNAQTPAGSEVTLMTGMDAQQAGQGFSDDVRGELKNLHLSFRHADATHSRAFDGMELSSYDSVVVLSHRVSDQEDPDTRVLQIVLRLSSQEIFAHLRRRVVVELLDRANAALFAGLGIRDVVVSPELISAQVAQISQQPVLGSIYRELLSAGGVEITLRSAHDYVEPESECRFEDLIFAAQQYSEIALGLVIGGQQILINPSRKTSWRLTDRDQVILLAQQLYR